MLKILITFLTLSLLAGCSKQNAIVTWDAPIEGANVHHYIIELDSGYTYITTDSTLKIRLDHGTIYVARVSAIGFDGRSGPYSEDSDPFELTP